MNLSPDKNASARDVWAEAFIRMAVALATRQEDGMTYHIGIAASEIEEITRTADQIAAAYTARFY